MSCLAVSSDLDKMQLVCAEDGISANKSVKTSCALCTKESVTINSNPLDVSRKINGQPYYLCTVTCCDSANCTKPSTTSLIGKAIVTRADSCLYSQYPTDSMSRTNGFFSHLDQTNCPLCIKARQARSRLVFQDNSTQDLAKPIKNGDCTNKPNSEDKSTVTKMDLGNLSVCKGSRKDSIRRSPKLQYLSTDNKLHSPELSSSPPILGNSSFTDYTETYTPVCTSVNSNPAESSVSHFKFGVGRKASPLNSEYSFYFSSVEHHGFFRKAVPALPIAVAVLFCMFNLVIPGSGTLLASITIILGSQTEYGPGYGCRSFSICFLSALLQFSTAIFVFGWVWSIMWGIVFIKNSLRYGERRDIHTMSLC